jgi:NADPH:quinone reductase-like Zn-dependent oxidoreductase
VIGPVRGLADWLDAGIVKPVIDSTFDLADLADAQRRVESRRARGKVVIRVSAHEERV